MEQPSIVFATHISYLDGAVEHIKLASTQFTNFNVVITLAPKQLFKNIIDLRHVNLKNYPAIVDFNEIKVEWKLELLEPYFEHCKTVNFLIFQEESLKRAFSVTRKFNAHIRHLKPQFIHFDSYINRQIVQLPFLFANRRKIILNVHDAKPHTGEEDSISTFIERCLYRWCSKFVTFSEFSKKLLQERLRSKKEVVSSCLLPFSFYRNYMNGASPHGRTNTISFVGRVSKYKGIDLFIEAINIVHKTLPDIEFVIAGKSFGGYVPDFQKVQNKDRLTIVQRHLSNSELVEIILGSNLIVCPYLDASQSGVVMTAIALDRPVLVTTAGGLKEYITDGKNGMVCEIDKNDLALKVIGFSSQGLFKQMTETIGSDLYKKELETRYRQVLVEKVYNN